MTLGQLFSDETYATKRLPKPASNYGFEPALATKPMLRYDCSKPQLQATCTRW